MIGIETKGSFKNTQDHLNKMLRGDIYSDLAKFGEVGVAALSKATPEETGLTAISWGYRIVKDQTHVGIEWYNTHKDSSGTPIAILIQYGHATGTGGYVQGRDFINPAMRPVFDQINEAIRKRVSA